MLADRMAGMGAPALLLFLVPFRHC